MLNCEAFRVLQAAPQQTAGRELPARRFQRVMGLGVCCCHTVTGRSAARRWSSDGTSIFSVADGRTLALTPPKEPTHFERIRAERLARAQLETPLVRGLRLMPEYTPGRCAVAVLFTRLRQVVRVSGRIWAEKTAGACMAAESRPV